MPGLSKQFVYYSGHSSKRLLSYDFGVCVSFHQYLWQAFRFGDESNSIIQAMRQRPEYLTELQCHSAAVVSPARLDAYFSSPAILPDVVSFG
jgi:hypothetical protein